jgi:hypothetical protein
MQENESIQIKPRRKRRSPGLIAELVREFGASGLTQRHFCEDRGIALSELQQSLKIVRRAKSTPKLLAVEVEDEQSVDCQLGKVIGSGLERVSVL